MSLYLLYSTHFRFSTILIKDVQDFSLRCVHVFFGHFGYTHFCPTFNCTCKSTPRGAIEKTIWNNFDTGSMVRNYTKTPQIPVRPSKYNPYEFSWLYVVYNVKALCFKFRCSGFKNWGPFWPSNIPPLTPAEDIPHTLAIKYMYMYDCIHFTFYIKMTLFNNVSNCHCDNPSATVLHPWLYTL